MFKITRNRDGYFLEAHVKLRPVDFPSEGIFVAGLAHAPKNLDETISQSLAAAGRAGVVSLKIVYRFRDHRQSIEKTCVCPA